MIRAKQITTVVAVAGLVTAVSTGVYALQCGFGDVTETLQLEPIEVTIDGEPASLQPYTGKEIRLEAGSWEETDNAATLVEFTSWDLDTDQTENSDEIFALFESSEEP